MTPRATSEDGQVTVLVIGMMIVVMAVSGLAVDGTRAFIERRALQNVADTAALAGADQLDLVSFYGSGGGVLELDVSAARAAALEMVGASRRDAVASITTEEGAVQVTLRGKVETSFLRFIGIGTLPVAVTARAEPQVGAIPAPEAP